MIRQIHPCLEQLILRSHYNQILELECEKKLNIQNKNKEKMIK